MAAPILGRAGISEFSHARHVGLFDRSEEHRTVKLLIDQHGDDAALNEATVACLERWPEWTQTERPTRLWHTSQARHGHIVPPAAVSYTLSVEEFSTWQRIIEDSVCVACA